MPPPSTFSPDTLPVTQGTGGGLSGAFGMDPNRLRTVLASLGGGMAAVGQMRPGQTRGAAFAGGLGGALQGGEKQQQFMEQQARQTKNDAFDQDLKNKNYELANTRTANQTRETNSRVPLRQAQAEALALKQKQDGASRSWWASDPGKYHMVEMETQKHVDGVQRRYQKDLDQAALMNDTEKADKIRALLKDEADKFRTEAYRRYKLNPDKAKAAMERGYEGPEEDIKYLPAGALFWDAKKNITRRRRLDEFNRPPSPEALGAGARLDAERPAAAALAEPTE